MQWYGISRSILCAIVLMTCTSLLADNGSDNNWPGWRGAGYNDASSQQSVFPEKFGLKVAWRQHIGSGYSGIAINGGRVITMGSDGEYDYMFALDAVTGEHLWRYKIDTAYPGHDGGNDGPCSTPAIGEKLAFGVGAKGQLFAVDLETGKEIWQTHLIKDHGGLEPHWGFATSPLIVNDYLIVETGGVTENAISAFDKETGKLHWTVGDDTVEYQSPFYGSILGRQQVIGAGKNYLLGIDDASGDVLWQYRHEGTGFYAKILNPLLIGEDRLFIKYRRGESKLLKVAKSGNDYQFETLWTTKHIKRNYNLPIYHQGHIYGHNGRFMSCIDAETGELVWKSRPPGDGFLIFVDDHLVVLTKKGSLHVVKATPESYQEVAGMQLFDKLVWTPPAFANGKIYARNSFSEMASVDVAKIRADVINPTLSKNTMRIPGSKFAKFVEKVEASSGKTALIDEFMNSHKTMPVYEGDSLVHIVYRGDAKDLAVTYSGVEAYQEQNMNHIAGTDFFYASLKFEPDARLSYKFTIDYDKQSADSLNPDKAPSVVYGGMMSQIFMPKAERPDFIAEPAEGKTGRLDSLLIEMPIQKVGDLNWGGDRKIYVYLPRGYDNSELRYPVMYMNYGQYLLHYTKTRNSLDNLIGNRIRPVIAAFISIKSAYEHARSQRDVYADMVVDKVVPAVDQAFRTIPSADARAIMGMDESGFSAYYIALRHPDVFQMAAAQSMLPIAEGHQMLLDMVENGKKQPLEFYLDWGKHDFRMQVRANDIPAYSRKLMSLLQQKGYPVSGGETNDGSDLAIWQLRFDELMEAFFTLDTE